MARSRLMLLWLSAGRGGKVGVHACVGAMGCGASAARGASGQAQVTRRPYGQAELRERLTSMGRTFSIEVGPGDVKVAEGTVGKPGTKLLELLRAAEAEGTQAPLQPGSVVFVNMVKPVMKHFAEVAAASSALASAGFAPVPHVPAARFESQASFQETVESLATTGHAASLLVLGGNDLAERVEQAACHYRSGACQVLLEELGAMKAKGIETVVVAGHPDGHPAFGDGSPETSKILLQKAELVYRAGMQLAVATQFCFDARKLVGWLRKTRAALVELAAGVRLETPDAAPRPPVIFHVGVPGPTPGKKLERIATMCEVPSLFLSSAFDVLDSDGDGLITCENVEDAVGMLGLARKGSKLHALCSQLAGADGRLTPGEFAQLLVEDAVRSVSKHSLSEAVARPPADPRAPAPVRATAVGPSAAVSGSGAVGGEVAALAKPEVVWPEELVLALAAFCASECIDEHELVLHFYPFGGLARTFELTSSLRDGTWPILSARQDVSARPRAS